MAPHGSALPRATTESAKAARKAFFCELCQKGYARMNEYEAHENSYDHQHRKRLKEMKQLTRDTSLSTQSRSSKDNSELQSIALPSKSATSSGPKKKPVFKAVGSSNQAVPAAVVPAAVLSAMVPSDPAFANEENDPSGAVRNGWISDRYDPGVISGCAVDCTACGGREESIVL